jgi:hypothetical protein
MIAGTLALALSLVLAPEPDVLPRTPRPHTLFFNFGGGLLSPGEDTAAGEAPCVADPFHFPPFLGEGAVAAAAVAEARRILAPYAVTVTATRPPASLEYTEVWIGGLPELFGLEPTLNGLTCRGVDCGDAFAFDTAFVFADKFAPSAAGDLGDAEDRGIAIGRIAVHEAGHAWGLEHSGGSESIMATFPSGAATQDFVIGCLDLDVPTGSFCPEQRQVACPPGQQDAHAEMRARFGMAGADTTPPTISIVSPLSGESFEPGTEITLEVEARDDTDAVGWSLRAPQVDFGWTAAPGVRMRDLVLPAGLLTLQVEAIDHAGNRATAEVTIRVRDPRPPSAPAAASCACRSTTSDPGQWPGWGWGLLLWARRRPSRRKWQEKRS